jgi:hypothetical protein
VNQQAKKNIVQIAFEPVDDEVLEIMVDDGAEKHGLLGWLDGASVHQQLEAALAHIWQHQAGERIDVDSGESPICHAIARLKVARSLEIEGVATDVSGGPHEDPGHPDDRGGGT